MAAGNVMCMLVLTLMDTIAGCGAFIAFIILKNYPASIFAIITGVTSGLQSLLHYLQYRGLLQSWYMSENTRHISYFGFFIFGIGAVCTTYYTVIEIILQTPVMPIATSVILPLVWAVMTLKSGLTLYYFGHKYYSRQRTDDLQRIINENSSGDLSVNNPAVVQDELTYSLP